MALVLRSKGSKDETMKRLPIFPSKKNKSHYGAASHSQALLEFALALPILLAMLFGIIDLAALFQAWLTVENIARQTVRYAVTGQYDPTFCVDDGTPCAGDTWEAEQDYARLLSVQAYAERQSVALFRTPGATQPEIGYLNIIICSSRDDDDNKVADFTFFEPSSSDYADCRKNGLTQNDAGAPGDRVYVAVDFNHPYITPFFNQVWPMTHLFSYRQGVVEKFRVPRLIALPELPDLPTLTPSTTSTATATGTATITPTATNTPLPIYIEIINPDPSGMIVTSLDQTRFEAIAWDPNVGTSNGDGIRNIKFWFAGPGYLPGRTEGQAGYCAFSGNSPCSRMDAVVDYTTLPNGTYTIYARAEGQDGRLSETISKTFILNFPPTPTPTITNTPTATPIPSCNDVSIVDSQVRNNSSTSDFRVTVRNDNQASGYLVYSLMTWDSPYSPPLYFDYFWFLNTQSVNRYYNPGGKLYDNTNPTISWSNSAGAASPLAGNAKTIWGARFDRQGEPSLSGTFYVYLTFYFPDLGECAVSTTLVQATAIPPTPTKTPTPTPTPVCKLSGSIKTTDFYGNPVNVNGYDCPYGCIHSPYLVTDNMEPGNYFWTVETVSKKIIVNEGTFTLAPGQQADPKGGIVVPLGLGIHDVPPGYFPGELKVTVWQSSDPGCNAKTDNFKIQALEPTPVPTNTIKPTYTPKPTSTPAPSTPTYTPTATPTFCFDC